MRIGQISRKQNRKKKVPTKYKSANILLSFYPTAPEPSEINFPAQSTSAIDVTYFFLIPVHPCLENSASLQVKFEIPPLGSTCNMAY